MIQSHTQSYCLGFVSLVGYHKHWAELPVPWSLLVIDFYHDSVCMLIPKSSCNPIPFPSVAMSLFSVSAGLFLQQLLNWCRPRLGKGWLSGRVFPEVCFCLACGARGFLCVKMTVGNSSSDENSDREATRQRPSVVGWAWSTAVRPFPGEVHLPRRASGRLEALRRAEGGPGRVRTPRSATRHERCEVPSLVDPQFSHL